MGSESAAITALLRSWRQGDSDALNQLLPVLYKELRHIAGRLMNREQGGRTLQPTALVNEAYIRLVAGAGEIDWKDRAHFLGICARLMRQVLVDASRKKSADKRGGKLLLLSRNELDFGYRDPMFDIVALNECLTRLAQIDPRKVEVFELRFFAGLEVTDVAEILGVSAASVKRDWKFACAWLRKELFSEAGAPGA